MKKQTVLALGADMKNRFLIASGKGLCFGPDIGDLGDAKNYELFKKALEKATKGIKPDVILCDLHPGYFSARFAEKQGRKRIQHHHAHIASVREEHRLEKPVIGVCFDGAGFGTDGNIWGGEFLIVRRRGFERAAHLGYHMMPGGDKVVGEPWRMVLSILRGGGMHYVKRAGKKEKKTVLAMCKRGINSPLTSSAGRLFDAAAALLGVCEYASFEAEGPMKLERMSRSGIEDTYGFGISRLRGQYVIDTTPLFLGMKTDLEEKKDKCAIAAKFHNSMADIVIKTVKKLSKISGIRDIALSGGVFQNEFLKKRAITHLASSGFNVFINKKSPVNDYNISLGQYHVFSSSGKG